MVEKLPDTVNNLEEYLQTMPGLKMIDDLVQEGNSFAQIARHFNIKRDTLYSWARKHPVIYQALVDSDETLLDTLEMALYSQCKHRFQREVVEVTDAEGHLVRRTTRTRDVFPDTDLIHKILISHRGEEWAPKLDVSASNNPIIIVDTIKARQREKEAMEAMDAEMEILEAPPDRQQAPKEDGI